MKPTILLVDVASDDRENQRAFLESQGCEVLIAESEEAAEQLCVQLQPDLVLLHEVGLKLHAQLLRGFQLQPDLVLLHEHHPRLAGADLCRRMKQDPLNKLTPIVLISSSPTPAEALRAREAGAADYWETPCSLRNALGRIEAFLRLKNYI